MKYQLLSIWLIHNKFKKKEFADLLNTSPQQVSHWIRNDFMVMDNGIGSCELVKLARRFEID